MRRAQRALVVALVMLPGCLDLESSSSPECDVTSVCRSHPLDLDAILKGEHGVSVLDKDAYVRSLGDINGDGRDDLCILNLVFLSQGDGVPISSATIDGRGFGIWHSLSGGVPGVFPLGDVNGDGFSDMHVIYGERWVAFGKSGVDDLYTDDLDAGIGGFPVLGVDVISPLGDVDGDGYDDVLVVKGESTYFSYGQPDFGPGDFVGAYSIASSVSVMNAFDYDGNGIHEFLVCDDGLLAVVSAPDGWGEPARQSYPVGGSCGAESNDADADGFVDLLVYSYVAEEWPRYQGHLVYGPFDFSGGITLESESFERTSLVQPPRLLDGDGDGSLEVLALRIDEAGQVSLRLEPRTLWSGEHENSRQCPDSSSEIVGADFPERLFGSYLVGDVDGDGREDLFVYESGRSAILTSICERGE